MPREKGDEWKHVTIVEESIKGIKVKCIYCRLCQRFLTIFILDEKIAIFNDFYLTSERLEQLWLRQ
jgi:hypothetical protein